MTLRQPWLIDGITEHKSEDYRHLIQRLFPVPGVLAAGDLAGSASATPDMKSWTAAGDVVVAGSVYTRQGHYHDYNDAALDSTHGPADATNPRNDIVGVRIYDANDGATGPDRRGAIEVIAGAPAAVPVDPVLPANWLSLRRVRIQSLATRNPSNVQNGDITDLRPRAGRGRSRKVRTAGNMALNSGSWADLDNSRFDTALAASAGDWVSLDFSALWNSEATTGWLNVVTIVAGSPVSTVSGPGTGATGSGVLAWHGSPSILSPCGGGVLYQVVAEDLAGGIVTFRLRYRTSGTKTLLSTADYQDIFSVANLGT